MTKKSNKKVEQKFFIQCVTIETKTDKKSYIITIVLLV